MPPRARRSDQLAELQALVEAQAAVRNQQSQLAQAGVRAAFEAVTDFYDPRQTRRAVATAAKVVGAAQRRTATAADAYLARSTSAITGRRVSPAGAVDVRSLRRKLPQAVLEELARAPRSDAGQGPPLSESAARRIVAAQDRVAAVDPEDVYGRIPDAIRFATVARGVSPEEAIRQGIGRAEVVADTDVMLADRAQASKFFSRKPSGVRGYRRVLHPELGSGNPPCGLCVVAADRLYRVEDLMPIHARCRCTVAAATAELDPGVQLNEQDLRRIYEAAGSTGGRELKRIRVEVTEHGEIGPVLVNAEHAFRGPREFAQTQSEDPETRILAELESLQEQLDGFIHNAGRDRYADESIAWYRTKIRELSARLP